MSVHIPSQIFKWKALDRWENKGGSFSVDRLSEYRNGLPGSVHENAHAQIPERSRELYSNEKHKEAII